MLGALTFILGLAMGATVTPWAYLICVAAIAGTALVQHGR